MNSITHTLTAFDGQYEKTIYNVGPAKVTIKTDDIYTDTTTRYFKIHSQTDDGSISVLQQDMSVDSGTLSGKEIVTNVYPSSAYHTTRSIHISGYKFVGTPDVFKINLKLRQSEILEQYGEINLVNADLFSAEEQKNNALLTFQSSKTREVFNIVVPFNKTATSATDPEPVVVDISLLDVLRTEQYSDIGGFAPILTEQGDYIARRIPFTGDVYLAYEVSVFKFNDNTANEIALLGERQVINEDGIEVDVIIIPEDVADSYEGSIKEVTY